MFWILESGLLHPFPGNVYRGKLQECLSLHFCIPSINHLFKIKEYWGGNKIQRGGILFLPSLLLFFLHKFLLFPLNWSKFIFSNLSDHMTEKPYNGWVQNEISSNNLSYPILEYKRPWAQRKWSTNFLLT